MNERMMHHSHHKMRFPCFKTCETSTKQAGGIFSFYFCFEFGFFFLKVNDFPMGSALGKN